MIKNKNDQLPIIYIGPFNAEYTKDDFVDTVSVLNNESIDKINDIEYTSIASGTKEYNVYLNLE